MKIVKPIATPQEVDVLVRDHTSTTYTITIIDESERVSTLSNVIGTYSNQRLTFDISHDFVEKSFYLMKIDVGAVGSGDYASADYASSDYSISVGVLNEIYRGKLFTTDSTDFEKYESISYKERETSNTFKVRR